MRPSSGRRDALITIESRTTTKDPVYNTDVVTWADYAQAWAEVQDVLPSKGESAADNINMAKRPARIRCLWIDGVTSAMRIVVEKDTARERTLQIVSGPVELGRLDGMEMMAEEYSTAGEAP